MPALSSRTNSDGCVPREVAAGFLAGPGLWRLRNRSSLGKCENARCYSSRSSPSARLRAGGSASRWPTCGGPPPAARSWSCGKISSPIPRPTPCSPRIWSAGARTSPPATGRRKPPPSAPPWRPMRGSVLEQALPAMMRCWLGTPWDFNGTAKGPGAGKIACGYFVATVLKDAGFQVDRYQLAQQPSENILRSFLPKDACDLSVGKDYQAFASDVGKTRTRRLSGRAGHACRVHGRGWRRFPFHPFLRLATVVRGR